MFSVLKHYLEVYMTDTALKVSRSLHCFTTFISHGVENYFPILWATGISDAIFITILLTFYMDLSVFLWFLYTLFCIDSDDKSVSIKLIMDNFIIIPF